MTELRIGDQLIRFDRDATIAAYSQIQDGGADRCSCSGCRNFARLRGEIYPQAFRDLLNTLGIDAMKEAEAVHDGPVKGNLHHYGGWFYFVGEILEKGERLSSTTLSGGFDVVLLPRSESTSDFQYWCSWIFPRPPASFGSKVAALEFATLLPWVLEEPFGPNKNSVDLKRDP